MNEYIFDIVTSGLEKGKLSIFVVDPVEIESEAI